jgi:hypothetical protein
VETGRSAMLHRPSKEAGNLVQVTVFHLPVTAL